MVKRAETRAFDGRHQGTHEMSLLEAVRRKGAFDIFASLVGAEGGASGVPKCESGEGGTVSLRCVDVTGMVWRKPKCEGG